MSLNKQVKAGSITHLTDARFFAAYDVAYIGFCFDPLSPDYISPQAALAIKGWINGPQIVAEFANQDIDNVRNIIEFFQPDVAEMDSQLGEGNIHQIAALGIPVALKTNWESRPATQGNYLYILLTDIPQGAELQSYEMQDLHPETRTFHNLLQMKGSPEKETGIKTYDEVADLLDAWSDS